VQCSYDIVAVLRQELKDLAVEGVDIVQFDEPVLTEILLAGKSATHTFMCAALAAAADPAAELERAVDLINRVIEGIEGPQLAIHICRGNWSKNEDVLLSGSYDDLMPYLSRMKVNQFVLEYATARAGSPSALRLLPAESSIGYGVVNPRASMIEKVAEIVERVLELTAFIASERIYLNPDCGFGTFAERPVADEHTAFSKLMALTQAATLLRRCNSPRSEN
jgi:5-methyltetrahydropteroyltriglutamate--homocysteine methyltransferase